MKKTLLLLCALFIFTTCKKNKTETPDSTGTAATANGSIKGKISLYNGDGTKVIGFQSILTVEIKSQNIRTSTDDAGNYILSNVAAGMLDIDVTGPDGTNLKLQQVTFPGNGTLIRNASMALTSTDTLLVRCFDSTLTDKRGLWIHLKIKNRSPKGATAAYAYFSKSNNFSPLSPNETMYVSPMYLQENPFGTGKFKLESFTQFSVLKDNTGLSSGQKVFVNVFLNPSGFNYYDPYMGRDIYYAATPSQNPAFEITIP